MYARNFFLQFLVSLVKLSQIKACCQKHSFDHDYYRSLQPWYEQYGPNYIQCPLIKSVSTQLQILNIFGNFSFPLIVNYVFCNFRLTLRFSKSSARPPLTVTVFVVLLLLVVCWKNQTKWNYAANVYIPQIKILVFRMTISHLVHLMAVSKRTLSNYDINSHVGCYDAELMAGVILMIWIL